MQRSVAAPALRVSLCAALLCAIGSTAAAQTLPSPWMARDVGAPTLSGSATYASGVFKINGAGTNIWGTADQFHFVYQQISGDVDLVARIDGFSAPSDWAKVGLMVRASLYGNAAHGSALITANGGVRFQSRSVSGGSTTMPSPQSGRTPVWLRLVRQGTRLTGYFSTNGSGWSTLGSATVSLGSTAYVGLVVSSVDPYSRATGLVSNVRVTRTGLPSGQQNRDIGAPAITGSTTYTNGAYTVRAAGADIWGTADQFHFVYQPMTGNGEVVARVSSLTRQHDWTKAGVMIRESLTAGSRHAMVLTSSAHGYAFQRRPETSAYSEHTYGGSGTAPGWVRLVRSGDLFEAYRSSDGRSWTRIGSDTIPMGDTVYAGLAVTSHNVSAATTAVFDNVRVASQSTGNQSPAVSITAPANGTTVTTPTTVTISAMASDPESRMASVDFYVGSTMIVRDTTSPYSASWSPSAVGTYALTAVAHDADGGSSTSGAVSVAVQSSTNRPPSVSLSTGGLLSFTAPATIAMTATASDPEGRLARVEFFSGTTRLGTDTSAPYTFSWSNVPAGVYTLTAVAYDAAGASATSAAVSVTVRSSVTSAPRSVAFMASSDHATNVTYYVLKVFASTANPSTATPVATSDLGKPTPSSTGEIVVDRATFFSALAAGNYLATVTAIGPGGQTQSGSISFSR